MIGMRDKGSEKGAALIVVLLLIATLSFILLSITNIVTAAVKRSAADRARTDFYWRAAAGELIAQQILEKYLATGPAKMVPGEGIFAKPIEVPIEGGKATIGFQDATRCFNVNSLVTGGQTGYTQPGAGSPTLVAALESIHLGSGEAQKLADVIEDYIDSDSNVDGQGAEDGFYTALPAPYRTSGQLIFSLSELRAMDGVSAKLYLDVRSYLCALDNSNPVNINGNWLNPERDAAFIAAQMPVGPGTSATDVQAAIRALPPGGVDNATNFPPPLNTLTVIRTTSDRIEALITLEVNDLTIEEKVLFDTTGGAPKFLARTFGDDY
jgi:general secretion pathway protein K